MTPGRCPPNDGRCGVRKTAATTDKASRHKATWAISPGSGTCTPGQQFGNLGFETGTRHPLDDQQRREPAPVAARLTDRPALKAKEAVMPGPSVPALILLVLVMAACRPDQPAPSAAQPAHSTAGSPTPAGTGQPLPGWQIHINSYAKFAIWHPSGWTISERQGTNRSLDLTLTPPTGRGGILLRRRFAAAPQPADLPNTRCTQIRVSQLPGLRCTDTITGSVTAVLTGTSQGDFTFQASRRSAGFSDFDAVLASFQLLRGA
ncbi:MAG: hypothetical protein JWN00_1181 [Actinomycetia bacterium]|nr:hypothetical protein [Actinomycetes bacterium]